MLILLFVIHVLIALALIGVVLLQKSEGGALGMGGGGMSGFMTGRSTANLLTRTTAILAVLFFATSILLVMLSNYVRAPHSIVDEGPPPAGAPRTPGTPATPSPAPAAPEPPATADAPSAAAPAPGAPAEPAPPAAPNAPPAR
jgi:preprotein translocase subunit SecG